MCPPERRLRRGLARPTGWSWPMTTELTGAEVPARRPHIGADTALRHRGTRADRDYPRQTPGMQPTSRLTIGIDLSAQPENTGTCTIEWEEGRGSVIEMSREGGCCDDELRSLLIRPKARIGIDVPLGWPSEFVRALGDYAVGESWPLGASLSNLRLRATDRMLSKVIAQHGRRPLYPLSVAADRIAMPAMRRLSSCRLSD